MYIALKQSYMTYQTNETIYTRWLEKKTKYTFQV